MASCEDRGDLDGRRYKVRLEVGLGPEEAEEAAAVSDKTALVECGTCGDDEVPLAQSTALSCQHRFCNTCWGNWIVAEFDKVRGQTAAFALLACALLPFSLFAPHY